MTVLRRIGLSAVAIAGLIVLLVWSLPVTLPYGLTIAGVDNVTFDSIEVGVHGARVDKLAIGKPPRQSVATIEADYSLQGLLNGQVERIRIDGLIVQAAYEDGTLSFGDGIEPKSDERQSGGDQAFGPIALVTPERLVIENSRIDVETSVGLLSVPISGTAAIVDDRLQFDVGVPSAVLNADEVTRLEAKLQLSGHLPLIAEPLAEKVEASGRIDVQATGIAWPGREGHFDLTSTMSLSLADGRLTLAGPIDLGGDIGSAEGNLSAAVEFDDELRPVKIEAGEAIFDLTEVDLGDIDLDRGRVMLRLDGALNDLTGALTLNLDGLAGAFGAVEVRGVKIERVFDLAMDNRVLDVTARAEGKKASVDQVAIVDGDDRIIESGWFTVQWPSRELPWLRIDLDEQSFNLDWALEIDPVRIDMTASRFWARIEDLALTLGGGPQGLRDGSLRIRQGRADLPSANLALVGIESDIRLGDQGLETEFPITIRAVRPLDEPQVFSPLGLRAEVNVAPSRVDVDGTLATTTIPKAVLDFAGGHDIETGMGKLDVKLPPLAFGAGQLQPADLSPMLEGLIDEAVGSIALDGAVTWQSGEFASDLALLIDELGFTIGPVQLSRINSVIRFDGIAPLTTLGDQLLSVGLLDVGLPLTDGLVSMQFRQDGRFAVDQLAWRLAGGRILAEPFTFGSDVQDLTLMLKAEQLDLDALLALMPLDDLTGEGRIDGTLPLTIGESAAIIGGELAAIDPGVLHYKPSTVPGILQAGGESVTLMLQALENFHYEALKISLDGETDGATAIGLHLKGANPNLYDGHPVEFNLNLEGNLASLIQTNLDNYQIPDRIRERLQDFER